MLDNIQFDTPVDSSSKYNSLDEYVRSGVEQFLSMLMLQEPNDFKHFNTRDAQKGAVKECARLIDSNETNPTPLQNPLAAWYQYALQDFIDGVFSKISPHLIPDEVIEKGGELDYIRDTVKHELHHHKGGRLNLRVI